MKYFFFSAVGDLKRSKIGFAGGVCFFEIQMVD